jgi:hypothetical protein
LLKIRILMYILLFIFVKDSNPQSQQANGRRPTP